MTVRRSDGVESSRRQDTERRSVKKTSGHNKIYTEEASWCHMTNEWQSGQALEEAVAERRFGGFSSGIDAAAIED